VDANNTLSVSTLRVNADSSLLAFTLVNTNIFMKNKKKYICIGLSVDANEKLKKKNYIGLSAST
jgi:hypothetical protein